MAGDHVRDTLREFILAKFLPGEDPGSLTDSTLLVTSGVITSLSMVELVTFIEETFDVELEEPDICAVRMDSIDRLTALIDQRSGPGPEPAVQ